MKSMPKLGYRFMRLGLGLRLRRLGKWVLGLRHRFHALRRRFSDKTVTYI
jgi:hypothetical protein